MMINSETLNKLFAIIIIISSISLLVVTIYYKFISNNKKNYFVWLSQIMFITFASTLVYFIINNGTAYKYKVIYGNHDIKSISTVDNHYEVHLDNNEIENTNNIMYGNETKFISRAKIIKKSVLGIKTYSEGELLVITPDVDNFDNLSNSEKNSIIAKCNSHNKVSANGIE